MNATGKNINYEVKGDILTITINLKKNGGVSKSGKSKVIASTQGNVSIEGTDVKLGVNCYQPIE